MQITVTLTLPEAQALRHTLLQCLHLARKSPTIADALGITPEMRSLSERAADHIQLPAPLPERLRR